MIDIDYSSDDFIMKSVNKEEIPYVQEWFNYNLTENTINASPIGIEEFFESFCASYISKDEYYMKVYDKNRKKFLGIVKGRIESENLHISLLMIDKEEQGLGVGSKVINELVRYFKEKVSIVNIITGIMADINNISIFWEKNGFKEYKRIKEYFELNGQSYDGILFKYTL